MNVQSSLYALECPDGMLDGFRFQAIGQANRSRSHAIFDIDPTRGAALHALDHSSRPDDVEREIAQFVRLRIAGIEISLRVIIVISQNLGIGVLRCDIQAELRDNGAADLRCECLEGLMHMLQVAINIQVVSIHRSNDRDFRMQLQERPVEFVGFHHDCRRVAHKKVRVVIFRNSAQKC